MESAGAKETPDEVERKGLGTPATRGLWMCNQRADSSFFYKKALLAALRRRALTPSKMVPR